MALSGNAKDLAVHPATPDRIEDLAELFATHAGTRGCWCMAHILPRTEHLAGWRNGENRKRFEALQRDCDPPPGLIAYEGDKPIAWCAIGPRTRYPTTTSPRATIYRNRDTTEDNDVWLMTCFFVRVGHRRSGATHALLEAAVELARRYGAKAVEGLPIAESYGKERDAYVGRQRLFAECGFECVAQPSPRRVIMRRRPRNVRKPSPARHSRHSVSPTCCGRVHTRQPASRTEDVVGAAKGMGLAVVVIGLLLGTACGKQAPKQAAAKTSGAPLFTGDPNGPYCRLTLTREVADMKAQMHHAGPGSAEQIKGSVDYANVFLKKGEGLAPLEMKAAFHTYAAAYLKTLEPLFAKYGHDEARFDKEASAEEKKVVNADPPANVQKAFGTILRYESQVCGVGGPKSTDVKFTGSSKSQTCELYRKDQTAHDKWLASDFSAKANRDFFTGRTATLDARDRAAAADPAVPAAIKKSIHTYAVHYRTRQLPVLAKHSYDWASVLEHGTADERHAITDSDADVWNQVALGSAYDDQVCSA